MIAPARVAAILGSLLLHVACSTTQYITSTNEGRLIVSDGKPELDDKTGIYTYKDAEGRKAIIRKADTVQVMGR